MKTSQKAFNSRPHTEVDISDTFYPTETSLSIHDLTRRSTGAFYRVLRHNTSFNSRPHTEVDGISEALPQASPSFNSRPHTEVDSCHRILKINIVLSIHDLTRRSTIIAGALLYSSYTFNSRPHTEVDVL